MIQKLWLRLRSDFLLVALALLFFPLYYLSPRDYGQLRPLVDTNTILILAGLMVVSRGLQESGLLTRFASGLLTRLGSERKLALTLIILAAVLSTLITNDVALFVFVPLVLSYQEDTELAVGKLVVFLAFAVNAGSSVSPFGNPQNIFLWQQSGVSVPDFVFAMLPLSLILLALVLVVASFSFSAKRVEASTRIEVKRSEAAVALLLYGPVLVLAAFGFPHIGFLFATGVYLLTKRSILYRIDWSLLVVFVLMFLCTGLLAELPGLARWLEELLDSPARIVVVSALLSQLLSNVPATLLLEGLVDDDWISLAWGASIGGFGLALGSLANLIALRLARGRRLLRTFHIFSVLLLGLSLILTLSLLL